MNIEELKKKSLYKMTNEELLVLINVLINEKVVVMFENDKLKSRIKKALELLDSYKLGKYDYALSPAGLLEFEDILKEEDDETTARFEI